MLIFLFFYLFEDERNVQSIYHLIYCLIFIDFNILLIVFFLIKNLLKDLKLKNDLLFSNVFSSHQNLSDLLFNA
jgi:hypothetical protein